MMRNLLNCHSIGLHSFPISLDNGLYKRIFYADTNHNLWKTDPLELAIHPHHVDIKITVLEGVLGNIIYEKSHIGTEMQSFVWDSVILNGKGGFKKIGSDTLQLKSSIAYGVNESFTMNACELHTVFVERGEKAIWIVEESTPSCDYFPINYSNWDLTKWNQEGLYIEVSEDVKMEYIKDYISMNQKEFSEKEMPNSIKLRGINPKRGKITDKQREWLEKYIKFVKQRNLSKNTIKRGTKILNTSNDILLRAIWKMNLLRVPQSKTIENAFETSAFVVNCLVQKEAELRSLVAPKFEIGGYFNSTTMEYIVPNHLFVNKEMPARF